MAFRRRIRRNRLARVMAKRMYGRRVFRRRNRRQRGIRSGIKNRSMHVPAYRLMPWPERTTTKMTVEYQIRLPTASQGYNYTAISMNGLREGIGQLQNVDQWSVTQAFTPSTPATVPSGFNLYMPTNDLGYQNYMVHAAKLAVDVKPQSLLDNGTCVILPMSSNITPLTGVGITLTTVTNLKNSPGNLCFDFSSNFRPYDNRKSLYQKCSIVDGRTSAEYNAQIDQYQGTRTANPDKEMWFVVAWWTDSGAAINAANGIVFRFSLTYWVEFYNFRSSPQQLNP